MSSLWLLTHLPRSKSTELVFEACSRRGHQVDLINPLETALLVSGDDASHAILGSDGSRKLPDGVITRLGSSSPLAGLHVIRELELRGVLVSNSSYGLERSRDKVRCFQELRAGGVDVPKTIAIAEFADLEAICAQIQGPPWILKLPVSTQGKGVMFVDSKTSLHSIVDAIHSLNGSLLLQEFVAESVGVDVRVLVVQGVARAAMRRKAKAGEFRSNLHRGGSPEKVALTEELVRISEKAANTLRLDIAGVDLLETRDGYKVIEVNGSPGLEGLQSVSEVDLAESLVELIERRIESR